MACCLGSLCLTLIPPMAFGSRRARWIFTVLIIVLLPAVNALLLHAELAVIFASVSGSLCAVAYRCLLGQD
ncbi:MAG: hypothetical protein ACI4O7_07890 [Aristaeellaceae bacterium]